MIVLDASIFILYGNNFVHVSVDCHLETLKTVLLAVFFVFVWGGGVNKVEMEMALVFGVSLVTLIKNTFSSLSKCKPKTSEETLPVNATIFGLI